MSLPRYLQTLHIFYETCSVISDDTIKEGIVKKKKIQQMFPEGTIVDKDLISRYLFLAMFELKHIKRLTYLHIKS